MRRTRLNVVPPTSKDLALAPAVNHEKVTALAPHVAAQVTYLDDDMPRETRTQKVRRLQAEAKALAREQLTDFESLLEAASRMALEIAEGGDVYSVGAREICRRMADELPRTIQTLQVVTRKA